MKFNDQISLLGRLICRLALATLFLPASIVFAGSDSFDAKSPPPQIQAPPASRSFEFEIGLPGWLSGMSGDVGVRGIVAPVDVKFIDLLKKVDEIPIVLAASLRYGRWEFFADGQYLHLSDSVTLPGVLFDRANIEIGSGLAEAFVGYRVIDCEKGSLSIYAGARYNYMSTELQIFDNGDPRFPALRQRLGIPDNLKVSGSIDWVDPVIGLGGKVRLSKPVSLYAKGDVGGFGVASDLTWQAQGGLEIQVARWLKSKVGWRYLKFDYTSGGFSNKTALNGPYIETDITF